MTVTGVLFVDGIHGIAVGRVPAKGDSDLGAVTWATDDGGKTWIHRLVTAPGFSFVAAQPGRGIVAIADCDVNDPTGCHPGLFLTGDLGASWHRLTSGRFSSVSFVDASHGWAIEGGRVPAGGRIARVAVTADGGISWTVRSTPCARFHMDAVGVSFVTQSQGWFACAYDVGAGAGAKAILHTTNGGTAWSCVASELIPECPNKDRISYSGYLSGIAMRPSGTGATWMDRGVTQKTIDGGSHWSDIPPASFDGVFVDEVTLRTDTDWATSAWDADLQEQLILSSSDAGQTWKTLAVVPSGQ